jgi:uncharacterized protein (DUF58 family)
MSESAGPLLRKVEWGRLQPLRLKARTVAEGLFAGAHRSRRRGPGVEFGGHRAYVPGDDLRWIDRHALMRHDKLVVREFETETDRVVHLLVDATASMGFAGQGAPADKVAYAALIAAALARVALASGDPVSLDWIGGVGVRAVPPSSGRDAFEHIVGALEAVRATGDLGADQHAFDRALQPIARRSRRGSVIVLLSDLLDLPPDAPVQLAALGTLGRRLAAVQVLDREERELPYSGSVRLRSLEGNVVVDTDADGARAHYYDRLEAHTRLWAAPLAARGSRLVRATTDLDPVEVVREILDVVWGGGA